MTERKTAAALRMERQFLTKRADQSEYERLYRDTQPGQSVYWHGFGEPPSITFRPGFDDIAFNRERQQSRKLIKGRFQGGNLGWIVRDDLELFAGLCGKPLDTPTPGQEQILELIRREGPMNIQLMKEMTGMLVKEITPVLHRLQEAFLVYEDQYDGEWDRAWYLLDEMFPDSDLTRYTRLEALCVLLPKFAYRHVVFDTKMAKSFYKLPEKDIKAAAAALVDRGELVCVEGAYALCRDAQRLAQAELEPPRSVFAMHRNDFLVKSNEHALKKQFRHPQYETLQYLLVDGEFCGAVVGKFKYGPYILEDVVLSLPADEAERRRAEITEAVYRVNGRERSLLRYNGQNL